MGLNLDNLGVRVHRDRCNVRPELTVLVSSGQNPTLRKAAAHRSVVHVNAHKPSAGQQKGLPQPVQLSLVNRLGSTPFWQESRVPTPSSQTCSPDHRPS
eukprot:1020100-Amphidinium_carterae.1